MSLSLSHRKPLDVGGVGIAAESLPPLDAGPIDLGAWFVGDPSAADQPLELEIGSGKGTFLVQQAQRSPGVNYIGLEYARSFWRFAADRCRRHGLANVRLVRAEAGAFLRNYVADGAFRQVHIYFPDPWPKKRHHKRRRIQVGLLRELHRVLFPSASGAPLAGRVHLVTDHEEYAHWMDLHLAAVDRLFERRSFESPESAGAAELVGTNFERKYRREGRPFFGLTLVKRPPESPPEGAPGTTPGTTPRTTLGFCPAIGPIITPGAGRSSIVPAAESVLGSQTRPSWR